MLCAQSDQTFKNYSLIMIGKFHSLLAILIESMECAAVVDIVAGALTLSSKLFKL
jgi:hypothetical protein